MSLIVIAEDEFMVGSMLADFLKDAGYEVVLAPHGRAALTLIQDKEPDLLISDYMMPLMTGEELAEAIRKHPTLGSMPILLVSGAQRHIAESRPDLFDAVLEKPYSLPQLLQTVSSLLNGSGHRG